MPRTRIIIANALLDARGWHASHESRSRDGANGGDAREPRHERPVESYLTEVARHAARSRSLR